MKLQLQTQENTEYKKEFLIAEFKEKLDILNKYKVFAELERRVLKPAKENINKHSDIQIEYRVKRKARTPVSIVFKARYKNKSDKLKSLQTESFELVKEVESQPIEHKIAPTEEHIQQTKEQMNKYLGQFRKTSF